MAHTVIPPHRVTTGTLELAHKGNINDKTIPERDREVRDFNITLIASATTRRSHLVIDTHRTDLGVTRQGCHHIHEMIVTANRTCVLFPSEDMITQRIDTHLTGAKRATVSVGKHLGDGRSKTPAEKSLPNVWWATSYRLLLRKFRQKTKRVPVEVIFLALAGGTVVCEGSGCGVGKSSAKTEESGSADLAGKRCAHCNANISTDRSRLMCACAPL